MHCPYQFEQVASECAYVLCYAWGKKQQAILLLFVLFFCCGVRIYFVMRGAKRNRPGFCCFSFVVCIIMFFAMRRANSNRPVSSVAVCVCSLLCVRQRATGQFWLLLCACDTLKCLQCLRGQSKCCFSVCVHLCTKAVCHASVKFNSSLFVFLLILTKTNSHVEYY